MDKLVWLTILALIVLLELTSCGEKYQVVFYPKKLCFKSNNENLKVMGIRGFERAFSVYRCECDFVLYDGDRINLNSPLVDSLIYSQINHNKEYKFKIFEYKNDTGEVSSRYKGIIPINSWNNDSVVVVAKYTH